MQNNVTELTHKLLRALDSNYNVIDMPTVIEIVSLLEKVTITKELLETTRLGKHVNELRRKTDNDSLSKRAKELVKKWRNMVLPDSNGQIKNFDDKKRPTSQLDTIQQQQSKKAKLNGSNNELELSDNSNSSFKDVINKTKRDVILINSDSNSSLIDTSKQEPLLEQQLPKKRGRKKGSKNHKNLLDEAETSFSNKLAVSRGNTKVKTTQELIASLQNKNNFKDDLSLRAAKLTERVSIIDQKLQTNTNRYKKNFQQQKINFNERNDKIIESGSVINDKSLLQQQDDVIIVDDNDTQQDDVVVVDEFDENQDELEGGLSEEQTTNLNEYEENKPTSLSVEEALSQLPPIDLKDVEEEDEDVPSCTCILKENKDFVLDDESEELKQRYEFQEDESCMARLYFEKKFHSELITPDDLHGKYLENINGNWGVGSNENHIKMTENGLYLNVVPNVNNECIPKDVVVNFSSENYQKYSISENERTEQEDVASDGGCNSETRVFREWHQVLDTPSYNGEIFKILPYVIID